MNEISLTFNKAIKKLFNTQITIGALKDVKKLKNSMNTKRYKIRRVNFLRWFHK